MVAVEVETTVRRVIEIDDEHRDSLAVLNLAVVRQHAGYNDEFGEVVRCSARIVGKGAAHTVETESLDPVAVLPLDLEERHTVLRWMLAEWTAYSNQKFNLVDVPAEQRDDHDASMREHGFTSQVEDAFWFRQVTQYFKRAELQGVDSLQGRQALMKGLMTLFDCCACMVRVHGLPPAPGVPTGEIAEWTP